MALQWLSFCDKQLIFNDNFPSKIVKLCLKNTSIFQNDTDIRFYFVCQQCFD